jgi:hypothetical protein
MLVASPCLAVPIGFGTFYISLTRGVSPLCGLAIYIEKHQAKEELWKLKYFTMQKYNLQKLVLKKPKSFKIL